MLAPKAPTKHSFIRESNSAIILDMEAWDSGGCPVLYFVIEYKEKSQSGVWRLVSNNVLVQSEFVIPDLTPGTSYSLQVTAHNNAGSTVSQYDVATKLTSTGRSDAVNATMPMFYLDIDQSSSC